MGLSILSFPLLRWYSICSDRIRRVPPHPLAVVLRSRAFACLFAGKHDVCDGGHGLGPCGPTASKGESQDIGGYRTRSSSSSTREINDSLTMILLSINVSRHVVFGEVEKRER